MTPTPPRPGKGTTGWKWSPGDDTARYLVDPGEITGPGKGSPGNLRHRRAHIVSGLKWFAFPVGLEGFEIDGQVSLGIHKYFGDNNVDARIMHREEGRITMSGLFPGKTAMSNYIACRDLLMSQPPERGMLLYAEGAFGREQYVLPEAWNFTHETEIGDSSIGYRITFIRLGVGKYLKDPSGSPPPANPSVSNQTPKGNARIWKVTSGSRTLRSIAQIVYGNAEKWPIIVDLNKDRTDKFAPYQLPYHVWPIGTEFRY